MWGKKWAKSLRSGLVLELNKVSVSKTKCNTHRFPLYSITALIVKKAAFNAIAELGAVGSGLFASSYPQCTHLVF